jgi:hypothetical protein
MEIITEVTKEQLLYDLEHFGINCILFIHIEWVGPKSKYWKLRWASLVLPHFGPNFLRTSQLPVDYFGDMMKLLVNVAD